MALLSKVPGATYAFFKFVIPVLGKTGQSAYQAVSPVLGDASQKFVEAAAPVIQETATRVAEVATPVLQETASRVAEVATPVLQETARTVQEATSPYVEQVVGQVQQAQQQALVPVQQAQQQVIGQVQQTQQQVIGQVQQAQQQVADQVQQAQQQALAPVQQAQQQVIGQVQQAQQQVADQVQQAQQQALAPVQQAQQQVIGQVQQAQQQVVDQVQQAQQQVAGQIGKSSVAIGFEATLKISKTVGTWNKSMQKWFIPIKIYTKVPSLALNSFNLEQPPNDLLRVAVIGGGPSAIFLCHALETQRRELVELGHDVSSIPTIRCFERSEGPGGVWRSDRTHDDKRGDAVVPPQRPPFEMGEPEEKKEEADPSMSSDCSTTIPCSKQQPQPQTQTTTTTTNMYSGLWTNGSKELFEFFDYTYRDHFGDVRMPTHLPRKYILEYFLARVTRNCPDFFERYFSFRTTVCVWAAGVNGIPRIPPDLVRILREGGFQGKVVHSSDTSDFEGDVAGKRVLLVGGGYSAEDLALMAIREGVARVYVTCRKDESDTDLGCTTRWPYDAVTVYGSTVLENVSGSTVTLQYVRWDSRSRNYRPDANTDRPVRRVVLRNIDTVIFCTGYQPNTAILEASLRTEPFAKSAISVPRDWEMNPSELNAKILGDERAASIRPEDDRVLSVQNHHAGHTNLYKGIFLIRDPDMMYLMEYDEGTDVPLLEIDIGAWAIARVLSNRVALPCAAEMRAETVGIHLECLHDPNLRYEMDWRYAEAIDRNSTDDETESDLWDANEEDRTLPLKYRLMGQIMNEFGYPVSFVEEDGRTFSKYYHVHMATERLDSRDMKRFRYDEEDSSSEEDDSCSEEGEEEDDDDGNDWAAGNTSVTRPGWRTFRDDPALEGCTSYFTGIRASSLPKPWVELNENDTLW
eukprot:jgi/Psemu1/282949/fgenesh1_pg.17_\